MKNKKIIRETLHRIKLIFMRSIANTRLRKIAKIKTKSPIIKVGYIVQMAEIWDKAAPVFDAMLVDERFDPFLIVVPAYDFVKSEIKDYGEELAFFLDNYGNERIVRAYEHEKWLDLRSFNFDYIFFQRCWEGYIPLQYRTREVVKYAKTCYIPYGIGGIKYDKIFYESSFFTSLYINFCSSKEQLGLQNNNKYKKNVYLGIPVLDNDDKSSVNCNGKKRLLWTPRWTEDALYGGSSFFTYKDKILEFKKIYPDIELILRPHPMTFENAIKTGRMIKDEVTRYKEKVQEYGAVFDKNKKVGLTFKQTSILITDYSSIILEYFLSEKPVIYCTDINISLSETYKYISKGFYVVRNWDELKLQVDKLINGEDELKEIRINLVKKLKQQNKGAVNKILEFIVNDSCPL